MSHFLYFQKKNWRVSGKIGLRELMWYASAVAIYATIITVISYVR